MVIFDNSFLASLYADKESSIFSFCSLTDTVNASYAFTTAKIPAANMVSHPVGVVVIQVHIAFILALIAVVNAPVANVTLPSLAASAVFEAVTLPLATASAFLAIILSNTFFACASLAAFSASSEIVSESVDSINPQVAKVSVEIPVAFASCSAVYLVFAADKVAIVKHCSFCFSVNKDEDSNTFCCATSKALNEVSNFVVFPVLFNTVEISVNCCLNIILFFCNLWMITVLWFV